MFFSYPSVADDADGCGAAARVRLRARARLRVRARWLARAQRVRRDLVDRQVHAGEGDARDLPSFANL